MKSIAALLPAVGAGLGLSFVLCGAASAEPAHFSLTNKTDVVVTRIDVETTSGDDWGTLEQGKLAPGETAKLEIDDGRADCTYHFRVYYEDDGQTKYRDYYNVNVCNNPAWTIP